MGGVIRRGEEFVPDEVAIVLDDERAAGGNVIEEALVGAGEFGAEFVSAHADDAWRSISRGRRT